MSQLSVLVTGATGNQGGAVVDHLLDKNVEVHGLTRSPDSDAAQALEDRGVTVVEGDLSDKDTLKPLISDVDGVYCVTQLIEYDDEVEQGTTMAEAAAEVGVDHFVFSSAAGAERDTGIPHFDSKYEIENRIRDLDLPATIVRPAVFMQNFENLEMMREPLLDGTLAMGLNHGVPLQLVDIDDIGAFVAEAFDDPDRYVGEAVELASDELTLQAMAVRLSDITETDIDVTSVPVDEIKEQMGEDLGMMFQWFNEHGYEADLPELRASHDIEFSRFETFLSENGWNSKLD
jgi:uncharacterized protein YbjT (DUF2867 family)